MVRELLGVIGQVASRENNISHGGGSLHSLLEAKSGFLFFRALISRKQDACLFIELVVIGLEAGLGLLLYLFLKGCQFPALYLEEVLSNGP